MDEQTLQFLVDLQTISVGEDWRRSLDSLVAAFRKGFVFDNLAVYLQEQAGGLAEAVYARAVGRGRSAEADASWGEEIANQVIVARKVIQKGPPEKPTEDRVQRPYLLGLPLTTLNGPGALVLIRFGGPKYESGQVLLAVLVSCMLSRLYDQHQSREQKALLEIARHRAQLQDDFIATVTHDLRTPIGFIKGYTTSLLRPDTVWKHETQQEFLTIIDEETDHLMALIDRMLDSARLQSGMLVMDFQLLRLDALIRDEAQRITAHHPELKVQLDLKPAPTIRADSMRLAQVFENLFDNSMKYAPQARITIRSRQAGDMLTVTFTDNGPGIPPEHMPFIFERFYRVPASLSNRGTGLGLFICREIVRAHGGTITVGSPGSGTGTMFRIQLPVDNRKGASK